MENTKIDSIFEIYISNCRGFLSGYGELDEAFITKEIIDIEDAFFSSEKQFLNSNVIGLCLAECCGGALQMMAQEAEGAAECFFDAAYITWSLVDALRDDETKALTLELIQNKEQFKMWAAQILDMRAAESV
jgi:hypothetical protein